MYALKTALFNFYLNERYGIISHVCAIFYAYIYRLEFSMVIVAGAVVPELSVAL